MNVESHFKRVKSYLSKKWQKSDRYKDYLIELTDEEVRQAKTIASKRLKENRNLGRAKGNLKREILGALGEFATIKWFIENGYETSYKKFFESRVELHHQDDFDTDLVWNGEDLSVEIKTTEKPMNSKLIVPKKQFEKGNAEIYVLICQIDEKTYCIKGFTTSDCLEEDDTLKYSGYSIKENDLIVTLEDLLENKS
jgi:hypothetical protein